MIPLRDAPIKRKLMLVILLASGMALALMGGILVTSELITFRRALTTNTGVLAHVIASLSTSSLAFENREDAEEVLSVLSAEPQITAAAMYTDKGELFARFIKPDSDGTIPDHPGPEGSRFTDSHLIMFRPILQEEKPQGTLYLQADLGQVYSRLWAYGAMLVAVGVGAGFSALGVAALLQRLISRPIMELAAVARSVSAGQDYSVRARRHSRDEIGDLTDAFNQMLTRIGEARSALAGSEERLRLALEGSETGTWDWNLVSGQATWDDYMFPLYGLNKQEWQHDPKGFLKVVHPDDRAEVERQIDEAIRQRRDLNIDFRIVDPHGGIRHMATRGRVFEDNAGNPVRMSGVSMDVTQAKQTEAALQSAKETAEAANRAKDEFLAILSHELRTPLSPVLTTLAILEEDHATPAALQGELEMIRRNVEVEARLIDDLLDITRISKGKLELHTAVVDLRLLVEHAVRNYLRNEAARKKLNVRLEVAPETETRILADSSRMTQVLWNLLQNACKFTPEGGAITIRVFNAASGQGAAPGVVVEIADTGIGIDPEVLPRIFDAFEQGERSRTRRFGGLGLGLAISRALIELHGGTLAAESGGRDRGSLFRITLPTASVPSSPASVHAGPSENSATSRQPPAKILLVEDHEDTARQLERLLNRSGHDVTMATNLAEARTRAAESRFDLVLSDLGLPDGTGYDLMRELSERYGVPGIALSGYGMEDDVRASLEAGFVRHLTKPVSWVELRSAIQEVVRATDGQSIAAESPAALGS